MFNKEDNIRIRAGRDFTVQWPVTVNDGAVPLSEANLSLQLIDPWNEVFPMEFTLSDDGTSIVFTIYGTQHDRIGNHTFVLWHNFGLRGQSVVDRFEALTLVPHSYMENIPKDNNITIGETITLTTGAFNVGIKGDKGDPFRFEDFTPEQLEMLRGPKGDKLTFEDLTDEEKEELRGAPGTPGQDGKDGNGIVKLEQTFKSNVDGGTNVITATLSDGTRVQFNISNGTKGSVGRAFQYSDFTDANKAELISFAVPAASEAARLAAEAVAAQEVANLIDGAPAAFDTFKELYEWIQTHSADAIQMSNDIRRNKEDIAKKQDILKSGENLRTVFGQSLLGEGGVKTPLFVTLDANASNADRRKTYLALDAWLASSHDDRTAYPVLVRFTAGEGDWGLGTFVAYEGDGRTIRVEGFTSEGAYDHDIYRFAVTLKSDGNYEVETAGLLDEYDLSICSEEAIARLFQDSDFNLDFNEDFGGSLPVLGEEGVKTVEVLGNGDVFVFGLGGYNGRNAGESGVLTLQEILNSNGLGL